MDVSSSAERRPSPVTRGRHCDSYGGEPWGGRDRIEGLASAAHRQCSERGAPPTRVAGLAGGLTAKNARSGAQKRRTRNLLAPLATPGLRIIIESRGFVEAGRSDACEGPSF